MRFVSPKTAHGRVYAVAGTGTVSFGIVASAALRKGLLGFAVERVDAADGAATWMDGFKVFASTDPRPQPGLHVSTTDHPVQSFLWDDFLAAPDHEYEYRFYAVTGTASALHRSSSPSLAVTVRTEPLHAGQHDVFFNRGVASSQAYSREFGNTRIDELDAATRARALAWLTRDLDEALLGFITGCAQGDTLLCCFYEFTYEPAAMALADAVGRGVDVRLVVDEKQNAQDFPRKGNLAMLRTVRFPKARIHPRTARPSAIAHNKFMVRLPHGGAATEVWTGSTNLSLGGVAGQTNVGHWVRDRAVADAYRRYWELLATDPGDGGTLAAFKKSVVALTEVPADLHDLPKGTTAAFSPRTDDSILTAYADLLDKARDQACITLAFGIGAAIKQRLADNTPDDALMFLLLEKRDAPNRKAPASFVRLNAANNVYEAWGSYLANPVYQWVKETSTAGLGLNKNVHYVHSKFLLADPLGADPIVVTGSANFSPASTTSNDENMLLIRGDTRVADIYLTEFNRIFNHYYFRSVVEATTPRPGAAPTRAGSAADAGSRFLDETPAWQDKYKPGRLRAKRLALMSGMKGATTL